MRAAQKIYEEDPKDDNYIGVVIHAKAVLQATRNLATLSSHRMMAIYDKEGDAPTKRLTRLINRDKVPKISKHEAKKMDADISEEEILAAIDSMEINKAPGPDGLTTDFYKKFKDLLAPILVCVFRDLEFNHSHSTDNFNIGDVMTLPRCHAGSNHILKP